MNLKLDFENAVRCSARSSRPTTLETYANMSLVYTLSQRFLKHLQPFATFIIVQTTQLHINTPINIPYQYIPYCWHRFWSVSQTAFMSFTGVMEEISKEHGTTYQDIGRLKILTIVEILCALQNMSNKLAQAIPI